MRSPLPLLACAALVLGVAVFVFGTGAADDPVESLAHAPVSGPTGATSDARVEALLARIEALTDRVDQLAMEVTGLRAAAARTPIASAATGSTASEAAPVVVPRELVAQVIAEERERLDSVRRAQREQRELDLILARAEGLAREAGLSPGEEKLLGDVLIEERQKTAELFAGLKNAESSEAKVGAKLALRDLASWRRDELAQRLGSETGERVAAVLEGGKRASSPGGDRPKSRRDAAGAPKKGGKRRQADG